jgi:alpha-D-ribose 1-methylphosphonate 5-triphosphate synthase subunit PhnG
MVNPPTAAVIPMEDQVCPKFEEKVRLHPFGVRKYLLSVDHHGLSFRDQSLAFDQVTDLRFGAEAIPFYRSSVGVTYQINLKASRRQLNIVFRSFFGLMEDFYTTLYNEVVACIWERVSDRLVQEKMDLLQAGRAFEVGDCTVSKAGVTLKISTGFSKKAYVVPWDDLTYEKLYNRLVLNSKSNQQIYTSLHYMETWNVDIFMALLDRLYHPDGETQKT